MRTEQVIEFIKEVFERQFAPVVPIEDPTSITREQVAEIKERSGGSLYELAIPVDLSIFRQEIIDNQTPDDAA